MIKHIVISSLVFFLVACQSKDYALTEEVSPSGLAYTLINMPDNPRISIQVAWPSSWAYADDRDSVVPRIGTRLLFAGGAEGYPAGEVIARINDINTQGDLWPEADHVFGVLHFSPEHQDESLKIANAHVRSPAFDKKWFERVRDEYAGQMNEARAQAKMQGFQAYRWATFQDTPLRAALSIADEGVVEGVKLSDVREWARTIFKRNGAVIAVAGDISAIDAGVAVDQLFEGLPEGSATLASSSTAEYSGKRILLHTPDSPTSTLSFIGKLPPAREGSFYEDRVIADALTGGLESGLFGAVRTELRASYSFVADVAELTNEHRIILLTGEVETAKLAEAEEKVREAYAEFHANPAIKKLSALKKPFETDLKEDLKDTGSVAYDAVISKIYGMDSSRAIKLLDEIDAITEETIRQRLSTAFPGVDDLSVIVDSPDENALPDACVITDPEDALSC